MNLLSKILNDIVNEIALMGLWIFITLIIFLFLIFYGVRKWIQKKENN